MNYSNRIKNGKVLLMSVKITSFISSMLPFSLFLFLKYWNQYELLLDAIPINIVVNSIFIGTVFSLLYLITFFKIMIKIGDFNRDHYHLKNIVQEKTNTSTYLLSNVLPVIALEMEEMYNIIFIAILIFFLGFMYIKNNLYFINPIYDIINIKVYNSDICKGNCTKFEKKFIISLTTLYEFDDNSYEGIKFGDILIISKRVD